MNNQTRLKALLSSIKLFNPDIFYLFNQPNWPEVVKFLKTYFPNARIVFDIKSPLLTDDGSTRTQIQQQGKSAQQYIDCLITHSTDSVPSWIPECKLSPVECSPGVDLKLFTPKENRQKLESDAALNCVYVSSLHQKRKTLEMLEGFAEFLEKSDNNPTLDIFGDGPERPIIEEFIESRQLSKFIKLHGAVNQDYLIQRLSDYDLGIAWVPKELYDTAPSLKSLEYIAAGLPVVATSTKAHSSLKTEGFEIELFDDSAEAFSSALTSLSENYLAHFSPVNNQKLIRKYDYSSLLKTVVIPELLKLCSSSNCEPMSSHRTSEIPTTKYRLFFNCDWLDDTVIDCINQLAEQNLTIYLSVPEHVKLDSELLHESIIALSLEAKLTLNELCSLDIDFLFPVVENYATIIPYLPRYTDRHHVVYIADFIKYSPSEASTHERWLREFTDILCLHSITRTNFPHSSQLVPTHEASSKLATNILNIISDGNQGCQPQIDNELLLHYRRSIKLV
jgi:glycosyltransferase involved in cell wall biosynthesis